MKAKWLMIPAAAAVLVSGSAFADLDLAKKSGCLACHSVEKKIVGPAWKDVAARYKGKWRSNASILTSCL
jgi:cytochrome c